MNIVVWSQFRAAIDMLENAMRADSSDGFAPPAPFTLSELDPEGVLPDRVYSKAELLAYLAHGREKCRVMLSALTEEKAALPCRFERRDMTVLELHLYNLRHVQHHTGQLNLILRQAIASAPDWVGKAKIGLQAKP